MFGIDLSRVDWAIVCATLLGPIFAVQVQKFIETTRERRNKKHWVFQHLMATRGSRVSADHVQALNMIALAFYGRRVFSVHWRSRTEIAVLDAWAEYHHHLNQRANENAVAVWVVEGDRLFINLLSAMAKHLGYEFDRVQLQSGAYSPLAHGELENQQAQLRRLAIAVLGGQQPLSMNIGSLPSEPEIVEAYKRLLIKLSAAVTDDGELRIKLPQKAAQPNGQ